MVPPPSKNSHYALNGLGHWGAGHSVAWTLGRWALSLLDTLALCTQSPGHSGARHSVAPPISLMYET